VLVDPTMISVAHWGRLDNGELLARARYVDWTTLRKRSFGFDVLTCPRPRAPARDPDGEQMDLGFDANAA
jgi:hypothetical protein